MRGGGTRGDLESQEGLKQQDYDGGADIRQRHTLESQEGLKLGNMPRHLGENIPHLESQEGLKQRRASREDVETLADATRISRRVETPLEVVDGVYVGNRG